jgi:hypothetical protein
MEITKEIATKVVNDYAAIMDAVPEIIKQSGYKVEYVAKKLCIPKSTFYSRRKKKAFFVDDMKKLVALMDNEMNLTSEEEKYFNAKIDKALASPYVSKEEINALRPRQ